MSETWNQLLYWITAQGQGSIAALSKTAQSLGLSHSADHLRRHLQLMGHLEVKPGARRWSVCRPVWIQQALGKSWFLAGERVPCSIQPQWQFSQQEQAPDRLSTEHPPDHTLDVGCTSRKLLNLLPDLADWRKNLVTYSLAHPLAEYSLERWEPDKKRFVTHLKTLDKHAHGVYRLSKRVKRSPMDQYPHCLYWDGDANNWLIADFTGLSFAHIYDNGEGLTALYQPAHHCLWIPQAQRWPYIYERCLILASGLYPTQELREQPYLKFEGIPQDFIERFEDLLDLRIENIP